MHELSAIFLFFVALAAGGINAIAGGGGLILFPALVIAGIPPVYANASNKTALWFGTFASAIAYRREFSHQHKTKLLLLTLVSVVGGIFGSHLLLNIPPAVFSWSIPYLMLTASLLFAFKKPFLEYFVFVRNTNLFNSTFHILLIIFLQLGISIYGGLFGGGAGILILAVLNIAGVDNIHEMNAYKSWLATCTNGIAIINLAISDTIIWNYVIIMAIGALIGGYGSAYIAKLVNSKWVAYFITSISFCLSIYLFLRKS